MLTINTCLPTTDYSAQPVIESDHKFRTKIILFDLYDHDNMTIFVLQNHKNADCVIDSCSMSFVNLIQSHVSTLLQRTNYTHFCVFLTADFDTSICSQIDNVKKLIFDCIDKNINAPSIPYINDNTFIMMYSHDDEYHYDNVDPIDD